MVPRESIRYFIKLGIILAVPCFIWHSFVIPVVITVMLTFFSAIIGIFWQECVPGIEKGVLKRYNLKLNIKKYIKIFFAEFLKIVGIYFLICDTRLKYLVKFIYSNLWNIIKAIPDILFGLFVIIALYTFTFMVSFFIYLASRGSKYQAYSFTFLFSISVAQYCIIEQGRLLEYFLPIHILNIFLTIWLVKKMIISCEEPQIDLENLTVEPPIIEKIKNDDKEDYFFK